MRVSESFTLANDMTCAGDGMVVITDNITIDLGGHTLTGPGMGPQTCHCRSSTASACAWAVTPA